MYTGTLKGSRIAIFEDDPTNRNRWSDYIKYFGGVPVEASPRAPELSEFEKYLADEKVSYVLCDHRLYERNYANYTGAKAIKASYLCGRGGVLVTAWEKDDAEVEIREFRRWIPVLIHSADLTPTGLESGLLQADREVRLKEPTDERIPFRTIMTIKRIIQKGSEQVVKVVMTQWNIENEVGFPLSIIPSEIQNEIVPGNMLIAQVNIGATRAEDLYFTAFERIDPDVLRKSETVLNNP